jgi:ParB family transcriptional regulator, chromosome partitioning protein
MTDTTAIALNKLLAWQGNVRKTDPDKGIDELAASIAAHGLLQSLVVRKDKRGKYAVVAGQRRLLALKSLAESEMIDADRPIACTIINGKVDATEISLAENVQREPMHPADEFDAFKGLIEGGMPVADVAARFGVTEAVVQKRLKLANVSPALIDAYRNGDMTLQHVMAFAVTEDHAAQERVWNALSDWQKDDPEKVRDLLTEHEITADDRRVKFVTLDAYEQAGGTIRRDLFSDGADGVFIEDVTLLETLVAKKLEATASTVREQAWKWVEIVSAFDHEHWSRCERLYPEPVLLMPEQQEELDALTAEAEALGELDELDDGQQERFDAVTARIDEFENGPTTWPAETLAIAGVVVTLGFDGEADIRYGYVKPEDAPAKPGSPKGQPRGKAGGQCPLPASLIESLTAHRSAALTATLLERPDIAFAATVHALALRVFYGNGASELTALKIVTQSPSLRRVEGSPAAVIIAAAEESWAEQLPCNPSDLFPWCLAQDGDTLRGLLAFCVARSVNAVVTRTDHAESSRIQHASMLAETLGLDMAAWFTPTAANYFSKVGKAAIIEAIREVKGDVAPAWSGMKKTDLATLAERTIAGTRWLPEPLRATAPVIAETAELAA